MVWIISKKLTVLSSIGAIVVDGKVDGGCGAGGAGPAAGAGGAQGPYHPPPPTPPGPAQQQQQPQSAVVALQHVAMHQVGHCNTITTAFNSTEFK